MRSTDTMRKNSAFSIPSAAFATSMFRAHLLDVEAADAGGDAPNMTAIQSHGAGFSGRIDNSGGTVPASTIYGQLGNSSLRCHWQSSGEHKYGRGWISSF